MSAPEKSVISLAAWQNKHFDGAEVENKGQFYKYPHDYPDHYVRQQYLPDILQGTVYYHFGQNKTEDAARRLPGNPAFQFGKARKRTDKLIIDLYILVKTVLKNLRF